jgi:hypothetical protein
MVGFEDSWQRARQLKEIADLRNEIENIKKQKKIKLDDDEPSRVQKILILHYLGVLKTIQNDTRKMSYLLSILISRDQDNIRKVLEKINIDKLERPSYKTEKNLQEVIKILESTGYIEAAKLATKDLEEVIKYNK